MARRTPQNFSLLSPLSHAAVAPGKRKFAPKRRELHYGKHLESFLSFPECGKMTGTSSPREERTYQRQEARTIFSRAAGLCEPENSRIQRSWLKRRLELKVPASGWEVTRLRERGSQQISSLLLLRREGFRAEGNQLVNLPRVANNCSSEELAHVSQT